MRYVFLMLLFIPYASTALAQEFLAPVQNPFGLDSILSRTSPAFVDLDDDGDLDMFGGSLQGYLLYFENVGSAASPVYNYVGLNPFNLSTSFLANTNPFFVDIDADGDYDLMVGTRTGLRFYENNGSPQNPDFSGPIDDPFSISSPPGRIRPVLEDIDADGDMDLFVGNEFGNLTFYENTGTSASPAFASGVINPFGIQKLIMFLMPTFGDLDDDGDLDLMIGDYHNRVLIYYENAGSPQLPSFSKVGVDTFGLQTSNVDCRKPFLVDIDDDEDLDLFLGSGLGDFWYFENIAPTGFKELLINKLQFRVFPNPAANRIHVHSNTSEVVRLELYSIWGDKVFEKWLSGSETVVHLGSFASGVYNIRVLKESGACLLNSKLYILDR